MKDIIIEIDEHFRIDVDAHNWKVMRHREVEERDPKTKEKTGRVRHEWDAIAFCVDLGAALHFIMKQKAYFGFDTVRINDLLSWWESISHSILDRVIREKKVLKQALEYNGVI